MPSKRQPSKQRRASENRAKRQALAARSTHAREPRSTTKPATSSSSTATSSTTRSPAASGGLFGGLGLGRRPGDGSGQPGARAMTMALLFLPISIIFFFVIPLIEVDDREELVPATFRGLYLGAREILTGSEVETENVSAWTANGPAALALLAVPILIVLASYYAYRRQPTGRTLTIAMLALAATVLFNIGAFFLPSLVAIGIASFQVRKSEMVAQQRAAAEDAGAAAADDEEDDEYDEDEDVEYEDAYDDEELEDDEELDETEEGDDETEDGDDEVDYEDGDIYDEFPDDEDAETDDSGKSAR